MEQAQKSSQQLPSIVDKDFPVQWTRSPTSVSLQSAAPSFTLPQLFVTTKAERYADLTAFDRKALQRPKAHFRNALKTTEDLERISKQLDARLNQLERERKNKVSFDRLSAHRDAFEDIIKCGGVFSPLLQEIKDMYNQYLVNTVSQQTQHHKDKTNPTLKHTLTSTDAIKATEGEKQSSSGDLQQLKKQLHYLEVESRVLIHENNRLREELVREKETYLKRKQQESASLADLKSGNPTVSPPTPPTTTQDMDYAAQVEDLQLKIAEERQAISKTTSERKGRVPLSVCHNLEQCLREVEIETQKCQRRNKHLHQEIKKWESELWGQLKTQGYSADLYRQICNTVITARTIKQTHQ